MKTTKRTVFIGAILFSLGLGCGNDSAGSLTVNADVLAVSGSSVSGEQLALPDCNGGGAMDKAGPVQRNELEDLKNLLGLSADQVAQVQPILDATRVALEELRAQVKAGTVTKADAQSQVKALHDAQKAQILALLTPEQQAKFSTMREHHADRFDLSRLTDVLALSADQVSQISVIQSATEAKVNDIHAQVEAGTLSKDDARTQLDQIRKDTQSAIEAVLTAEQKAKLEQILAAGPPPGAPPSGGPGGGKGAPCPPGGGAPGGTGTGTSGGTGSPGSSSNATATGSA